METKHKVVNLIILDESASMDVIKSQIISGFNEVVQSVKNVATRFPEQEHLITFVTFNSAGIKTHLDWEPVERLDTISKETFRPAEMTPLYDAMGLSINRIRRVTDSLSKCNVLVTILTDGEENSSREYTGPMIKQLVDELKEKNWTFTYIGANHNVEEFAMTISITNVMQFDTTEAGIKEMFSKEMASRERYSEKIHLGESTAEGFYEK